jgi:hypothetical protein
MIISAERTGSEGEFEKRAEGEGDDGVGHAGGSRAQVRTLVVCSRGVVVHE